MSSFDISVSVKSYTPIKDYKSSKLHVDFKGKDVYPKLINSISRVASTHLPSYAYAKQLITIDENTCVAYDNQYMQLRLSNLPLFNLNLDLYHLHDKYWKNINYADQNREKHELEQDIKFYVNATNNTTEMKYVTTNDAQIYIDGKLTTNMYDKKYPILLIKLRPGDKFKCSMSAVLGVGESDAIWRTAVNAYAPYEDNIYSLYICGNGQETEFSILTKSCKHIIKRLEDIKKVIQDKVGNEEIKNTENVILILDGEDHTMGEIINYELQNHQNLISGVSKPDLLIRSVTFKISAKEPSKMIKSILETIDILTDKYKYILKQVEKLEKK